MDQHHDLRYLTGGLTVRPDLVLGRTVCGKSALSV